MFSVCNSCWKSIKDGGVVLEEHQNLIRISGRIDRCEICGEYHQAAEMHQCTGNCAPFPRYGRKVVGPSETKARTE